MAGPRTTLSTAGGAAVALAQAAPLPGPALQTVRTAPTAADPSAPLIALVALVAWALLTWLLLVAAAAVAARLPGLAGRAADRVAARIAPAAIRRIVEMALGLTVAAGVLGASPASASAVSAHPGLPPAPPAASVSLDWPSPPASLDWNPTVAPVPATPTAASTQATSPAAVVVHPGDSLWSVAADHLPTTASDADIAAAWPTWWAANRDAVGADPDLIQPGLHLTPPAHTPPVQH